MPAEFCDTNVLVYAYDRSEPGKQQRAQEVVSRLWEDRSGVISVQVLQELFVVLSRRVAPQQSRAVVADYADGWQVVEPGHQDVMAAIDHALEWQLSFWDAMLLTSAAKAGAEIMWSEDLQHARRYGSVRVLNPFGEGA
jgi:predicted nucleic acid-binding protein